MCERRGKVWEGVWEDVWEGVCEGVWEGVWEEGRWKAGRCGGVNNII